jgi:hypothetical protein
LKVVARGPFGLDRPRALGRNRPDPVVQLDELGALDFPGQDRRGPDDNVAGRGDELLHSQRLGAAGEASAAAGEDGDELDKGDGEDEASQKHRSAPTQIM